MTEAEWLACTDAKPMLEFLRGKVSDRKLRLFACACCRRLWQLVTEDVFRNAVVVAERFADGAATDEELRSAYDCAGAAAGDDDANIAFADAAAPINLVDVAEVSRRTVQAVAAESYSRTPCPGDSLAPADLACAAAAEVESASQCNLLRDVTGNPFRSLTLDTGWLSLPLLGLAQTIHAGCNFERMAELAAALEEAGINSADVLKHCRQAGEHVRGCWVVDLILGKE